MTASHSCSVMLASTRSRRMPALLTTACRSPNVSIAVLMRRCAPSQSATLSPLATASPPIPMISLTTSCAGEMSPPEPSISPPRSLTTTFAPWRARLSACSRPMPRPAPVTIATRPSTNPAMLASPFDRSSLRDRSRCCGCRRLARVPFGGSPPRRIVESDPRVTASRRAADRRSEQPPLTRGRPSPLVCDKTLADRVAHSLSQTWIERHVGIRSRLGGAGSNGRP